MSGSVTIEKLEQAFRNDKRARKEMHKLFIFATAQYDFINHRSEAVENRRSAAIVELRESLGQEHFERVAKRIDRMIRGEGERIAG